MKIHESKYLGDHHKFDSREIVARLKNEIISAICENIQFSDREQFYRVNSKISSIIDQLVIVMGVEYHADNRMMTMVGNTIPEDKFKEQVIHHLSHQIAKYLMDSNEIWITRHSRPWAETLFSVSIPFIKAGELR